MHSLLCGLPGIAYYRASPHEGTESLLQAPKAASIYIYAGALQRICAR